jgi:hypothetical protein
VAPRALQRVGLAIDAGSVLHMRTGLPGPGDIVLMNQMIANGDHLIGHVRTFTSTHEVWGVEDGPQGDHCGTGVFVRTDSRSFRAYALSGGP